MTYKEVYDRVLPEHKRKEEKYNLFVSLVVRPVSVAMTLPFIKTKVKPTTITKWSVLFLIVGFVCLTCGCNMSTKVFGWLCFFVWSLLDGVDGNLARCTNQCSLLGDLWDTMGGYAAMVLFYFSSGIVAFNDINKIVFFENYWYLIFGGATAIMSIFPRLVMHKKKSSNTNSVAIKQLSDKEQFGLKNIIAMNLISPSGFMQVIFLVSILCHCLNVFIIFYFVINFVVMILSLYKLLRE